MNEKKNEPKLWLDRHELQRILDVLIDDGYEIVGPTVEQGAIVYDRISSADDLPRGIRDQQEPGKYRLEAVGDEYCFSFAVGPHSWKKYLTPPMLALMRVKQKDSELEIEEVVQKPQKFAFLGVRGCELAAISIQDRLWLDPAHVDPVYRQRRESSLILAVNCTTPAATCFCSSMQTGPACLAGYDIALTELKAGFVIEVGSSSGAAFVQRLPVRPATQAEMDEAKQSLAHAEAKITKQMPQVDDHAKLLKKLKHPHWQSVAERCLSCANCTMVCPTCFCHSVDDVSDLNNGDITRIRRWDSCFNLDFSHASGTPIRDTTASRYRQWLTHKLASWIDQFGSSGCVGCGRCITWCPVGIDLTQEVATLMEEPVDV